MLYLMRRLLGQWMVQLRAGSVVIEEAKAIKLAEKFGFQVYGLKLSKDMKVFVDDQTSKVEVNARLLLWRSGKKYVGEIKGTDFDPSDNGTRRQFIDYRMGFGADGVILLDVGGGKIKRIEFDRELQLPTWSWVVIGAIAGAYLEIRCGWATWIIAKLTRFILH